MPSIGIGIGIGLGNIGIQTWTSLYDKIIATQSSNLLAYLPLNDASGVIALNHAPARSGINILKNPSFEENYVPFSSWGDNLGNGSKAIVTNDVHTAGGHAAKLTAVSSDVIIINTFSVVPSKNYTLKLWTHGDSTKSLTCQVVRGDWGSYLSNADTGITGLDYTEYVAHFTTPAIFTTAILSLSINSTAGSVWIDDISISCDTVDATLFNGTYISGVTLAEAGLSGLSALFNGSQGVALNKPSYSNHFPKSEGSFVIYGKTTLAALIDGAARWLFKFKTVSDAGANYIDCFKDAGNNKLGWQFNDDGNEGLYRTTAWTTVDWFSIGATWSAANGLKMFLNGIQIGASVAITGVWLKDFWYDSMALGHPASNAGGAGGWIGNLQNFAMWNIELTANEMLKVGIKNS